MSEASQAQVKATPATHLLTPAHPGMLQRKCGCGGSASVSGQCRQCKNKPQLLQRYSNSRSADSMLASLADSSFPTPPRDSQNNFAYRLSHSFGQVKVHNRTPQKLQPKLSISSPTDQHEQEADRAAELITGTSLRSADEPSHLSPTLSSTQPLIQRSPADDNASAEVSPAPAAATPETAPQAGTAEQTSSGGLIVEDDAAQLAPGQMQKTQFLDQLQSEVCAAADAELASAGRSTEGCPYIEKWIGYYRSRPPQYVERSLRKYAPEAAGAASASDYIPFVAQRVRRAVAVWDTTGEITGIPEGAAAAPPETGATEGSEPSSVATGNTQFKDGAGGAKSPDNPAAVVAQLNGGRPLDTGVRSRMESAFGYDFSNVRIHTDTKAAGISSGLNARAITIGRDVAFASGEFQPGTLVGDALLAHELAHVVQQNGAESSAGPLPKGGAAYNTLEEDADQSAAGAVMSLWGGARGKLVDISRRTMPSLKSGLRLSRCGTKREKLNACVQPVQIADDDGKNPTALPSFDLTKEVWKKCCVFVSVTEPKMISGTAFKEVDESPSNTPTNEQVSLYDSHIKAGGSSGCIPVFVPQTFRKVTYTITNESLTKMKAEGVTDEVITKLKDMTDQEYGKDVFQELLDKKIGDKTAIAVILKHAVKNEQAGKKVSGGGATYRDGQSNAMVFVLEGADQRVVAHEVGHAIGYFTHEQGGTENITNPKSASNEVNEDICGYIRDTSKSVTHTGDKECKWDI